MKWHVIKSIVAMVRNMLKFKGVVHEIWEEAVNTSIYVLNCSPSRSLEGKTPNDTWTEVRPKVKDLRIFWSLVHIKKLGKQQKKLEDRSQPMIFIGYKVGTKAYMFYCPNRKLVHINKDVIF